MNIFQSRLTKQEWINIELPPDKHEMDILYIIKHHDKDIKYYKLINICDYLKLSPSYDWDIFIYNKFIKSTLIKINTKLNIDYSLQSTSTLNIKNKDKIKIDNLSTQIGNHKKKIVEFILLECLLKFSKSKTSKYTYLFALHYFLSTSIHINKILYDYIKLVVSNSNPDIKRMLLEYNECVKHNKYIELFKHSALYPHQKTILDYFNRPYTSPKLIFYKIPTGLGKTLTPIGLVKHYKVIFVCAAKHIGLSLAKAAISQDIKIALAFQCETENDIRLHFNAAAEAILDYKSGGIKKVNNLRGENVELMITDISSYLISMNYMKSFNKVEELIFFWDEPTITLDYVNHEYHSIIQNNWQNNVIPNIVLSSATLPAQYELSDFINHFNDRFSNGDVIDINSEIVSRDIYLLKENNEIFIPHKDFGFLQFKYYLDKIKDHPTLYNYLPIKYVCQFITSNVVMQFDTIKQTYKDVFKSLADITPDKIRDYYFYCANRLTNEQYIKLSDIHRDTLIYKSSIFVTSRDAKTITGGPSIFMTDNIEKTASIFFKKSKIDQTIIHTLIHTINENNKINDEITILQKEFEDLYSKENTNDEKYRLSDELKEKRRTINHLQNKIKKISIPDHYIPNKKDHYVKYHGEPLSNDLFCSNIDEETIQQVVLLDNIDNIWKILLLMGIGVFKHHTNITYTEIIKKLADEQKLYLIIASPDYIYGTNYNFCHGYISKDLKHITPEKTIQAIGRVGRKQQNCLYTMRFRDDNLLTQIFLPNQHNIEAYNLNRLLS